MLHVVTGLFQGCCKVVRLQCFAVYNMLLHVARCCRIVARLLVSVVTRVACCYTLLQGRYRVVAGLLQGCYRVVSGLFHVVAGLFHVVAGLFHSVILLSRYSWSQLL